MFNLFKKKKSLSEIETEKDVVLYSIDWMLSMDIITIDEYNRIVTHISSLVRNWDE